MEAVQTRVSRSLQLIGQLDSQALELVDQVDEQLSEPDPSARATMDVALLTRTQALAEADFLYESLDKVVQYLKADIARTGVPDARAKAKPKIRAITMKTHAEPTYCVCKRESSGRMVACDGPKCPIEWYHFECVGLDRAPRGKWFCDLCRKT